MRKSIKEYRNTRTRVKRVRVFVYPILHHQNRGGLYMLHTNGIILNIGGFWNEQNNFYEEY